MTQNLYYSVETRPISLLRTQGEMRATYLAKKLIFARAGPTKEGTEFYDAVITGSPGEQ
jgi:hypothetical protein